MSSPAAEGVNLPSFPTSPPLWVGEDTHPPKFTSNTRGTAKTAPSSSSPSQRSAWFFSYSFFFSGISQVPPHRVSGKIPLLLPGIPPPVRGRVVVLAAVEEVAILVGVVVRIREIFRAVLLPFVCRAIGQPPPRHFLDGHIDLEHSRYAV